MHKVYLVIRPAGVDPITHRSYGPDYHWYRQDLNGKWSHKMGGTEATDRDASGNVIVDMESADTGLYSIRCGYLCTCAGSADIE
jgi:hypothetical protein